jgi:predicted Fe-Mo cluster-binding NifX family protein
VKKLTLAVATADRKTVAEHLARAAAFVVFEIEDGVAGEPAVRERGTDACGNHRTFVELLAGCDAVICGGISDTAEQMLARHGVRSVVSKERPAVEEAVERYLNGLLETTAERACLCAH